MRDFKYFIIANSWDNKSLKQATVAASRMAEFLNNGYDVYMANVANDSVHYILVKTS